MRIMVTILVVYMKQDQKFVKIIHQNHNRMKYVTQIGKRSGVKIPANLWL